MPLAAAPSIGVQVTEHARIEKFVQIGITLEQYEGGLKRKEQETRAELAQASAADKDRVVLLEKQLADVWARLENPNDALEEYKSRLAQAYRALDDLIQQIPFKLLQDAQHALAEGRSDHAEKIFYEVYSQGKERAAEAAYQLAELAYGRIDYAAAYRYSREAADLQPDNPLYLTKAGVIANKVGRYQEAELLLQRSLIIYDHVLGPDHPGVAASLEHVGSLYLAQGRYAEAEPLYQRSLAINEKALGRDHPNVAVSLNNLAGLYQAQGRYAEAEPLYQRSLAIIEKVLGPDHPDVATGLHNLAMLYCAQGRYAEAEPLYQRSLAIREKVLGPDHPDVAATLGSLASFSNCGRLRKLSYRCRVHCSLRGWNIVHPMMALGASASQCCKRSRPRLACSNGARGMAVASFRQRYRPPPADLVVQPIIR